MTISCHVASYLLTLLQIYDDIEPKLLKTVEDAVLNRNDTATEALLDAAEVRVYCNSFFRYNCT